MKSVDMLLVDTNNGLLLIEKKVIFCYNLLVGKCYKNWN